jgi:hypothetical protein
MQHALDALYRRRYDGQAVGPAPFVVDLVERIEIVGRFDKHRAFD